MNRTRWLVTAIAALAVVLGGGAALASAGSNDPASDFFGDVAKRLGISQDKLEDAIKDATIARIDAAVAAGDITKEEGDALKERVRSGDVPAILPSFRDPPGQNGVFGPDGWFGPGHLAGPDLLDTAADYLGMTEASVREALRDGKSLAELAKAKDKSVDGLKNALRNEIRKDADQAVEDGELTRAQADRLVEKFGNGIDKLVDASLRRGFDFDFRSDGGNFEFHFEMTPEGRMPLPEEHGNENPSLEPAIVPSSEPI